MDAHLSELREHRDALAHRLRRRVVPPPQQGRDEHPVVVIYVCDPGEHAQAVVARVYDVRGVHEVPDRDCFGAVGGGVVPFQDHGRAVAFAGAEEEAVALWEVKYA